MNLKARRPALPVLLAVCLPLALAGCGGQPPKPDRIWSDLAREVWYQSGNVSTDLISAPQGVGLENLDYGWSQVHLEDADRAALEVTEQVARLFFFSADGDTEALEVDVSAVGKGQLKRAPLTLRLNGEPLTQLPLVRKWKRHRVEIPVGLVRQGRNLLELRFPKPRQNPRWPQRLRARVRSARFFAANGHATWPQRPSRMILVDDPTSGTDFGKIEMPSPGWLELVAHLPEEARLRARFRVERPEGSDSEPVLVYAKLLDPRLDEHHLAQQRVTNSQKDYDFESDLDAWKGETVRIRLGVSGPGNAVVSWRWAVVEGPSGRAPRHDIEPIARQQPAISGRLGRPDILVVLLDAARADAFSPFGGAHPTPAAERLASQGTCFAEAMATSSWTGQSVSSILTGFFPDSLGVGPWGSRLPDGIQTLAELLSNVGYRTVLWSQHPFYDQQVDLKRGFQEFHRAPFRDYTSLPSLEQLVSSEVPTLAFVHLIPPHAPYAPPPPHRGAFTAWYSGSIEPDPDFLNSFPTRRTADQLTEADRRYIRDRYDENVAFADAQLGSLLSMLDGAGRYDSSLVILLSDHGEAFMEHGYFLHTNTLNREMLHVPLVIKWPKEVSGFRPRVAEPVSLVDLLPTLTDGLAIGNSEGGFQGRSLLPSVFDATDRPSVLWATTRGAAKYDAPPSPWQMLQAGPWKILVDPLSGRSRLYQLQDDPAETRDLSADLPMRTLLLRQALRRQAVLNRELLRVQSTSEPVEELDAEIEDQLKALGYVN